MSKWLDWLKANVATLKDIFTMLREIILVICIALLLLFPEGFNSILVRAGFTEADFGPIKWKRQLEEMQRETAAADSLLASMETNLVGAKTVLESRARSLDNTAPDATEVTTKLDSSIVSSQMLRQKLKDNLERQKALLKEIEQE